MLTVAPNTEVLGGDKNYMYLPYLHFLETGPKLKL